MPKSLFPAFKPQEETSYWNKKWLKSDFKQKLVCIFLLSTVNGMDILQCLDWGVSRGLFSIIQILFILKQIIEINF